MNYGRLFYFFWRDLIINIMCMYMFALNVVKYMYNMYSES